MSKEYMKTANNDGKHFRKITMHLKLPTTI